MSGQVHHLPALDLLRSLREGSVDMVYTDPPFGTGDMQTATRKRGKNIVSKISYSDKYANYLEFLRPHLEELHRVLNETGTMYLHMDHRWVHYAKVECDSIFGRHNFLNEIIWSYNVGGRGRDRFPQKHDTILVYTKDMERHIFNWDDVDRIPYAAPELQYVGRSKEEAERRIALGQVPTDVWSMSIVGTMSKERLGYPSQKPLKLVGRCIVASSPPGGLILDPFAGSGTTGAAAAANGRNFLLADQSPDAIAVMRRRFSGHVDTVFHE